MKSIVADTYDPDLFDYITSGIKAHNDSLSPHHQASRAKTTKKHLSLGVFDDGAALIGGLLGQLHWQWLKIDELFIHDAHRKKGLGSQLVYEAMEISLEHECQMAMVSTFSFQARAFYEKLGFIVTGELRDYPPGESLFWLTRDLSKT